MDDLGAQINAVLNDPQQMAQIMGLAKNLMGGGEAPAAQAPAAAPKPLGGLGALLQGGDRGKDRQALLEALRPYLAEKRQRKLERALRITRMAQLARGALAQLGGEEHA